MFDSPQLLAAWKRSIPVERRPSGVGPDAVVALRDIKDYDPALRIMWDQMREVVVIWRQPHTGKSPVIVSDSPFGQVVDARMIRWLRSCDTRGKFLTIDELMEDVDRHNRERQREKAKEDYDKLVDEDKAKWVFDLAERDRTGKIGKLFVNVPAQVGGSHAGE